MSDEQRTGDEPWNDVPADDDLPGGVAEPAPGEVVGDEDDPAERDLASHRVPDPMEKYTPDTLDQRLAEEEPDVAASRADEASPELVDMRDGSGEVRLGERDSNDGTAVAEEPAAEEAAIHVVDEDRVL